MGNPKNKILKVNLQNHILDCRMMIDYIDDCVVADRSTWVSETRLASIYSQLKDSLAVLSEADSLDLEDDHNYAHTLYNIMTVMKEKTNFPSSKVFWIGFTDYKKIWLRNNKINNIIE